MTSHTLAIFLAKYFFVVNILLVLGAWVRSKKTKEQWTPFVLTIILTGLLGLIASQLYVHARPFVALGIQPLIPHAINNSFPSDHTLLTAALAAGLWFVSRRLSLLAWIVALAVGYGRVATYVHWPIDIYGSIFIAIIAACIASFVSERIQLPFSKKLKKW